MSVEEIRSEALKLSEEERELLADDLYISLKDEEDDPELIAELKRRWEELRSGRVRAIPWEETEAKINAILRAPREVTSRG